MEIARRKFQGVLNILSFNRHFYYAGIAFLAAILLVGYWLHLPHIVLLLILTAFIYGLVMPLIISAYVYDFSGYYNFKWLQQCDINNSDTTHIVNINAGFDETSFILQQHFPQAALNVFDFYNAKQHTEPAIIRARKVSDTFPNTRSIETNNIPLATGTADIVFLLSAAHEIRNHDEKIIFLKECHRICKPNGKVIMVEHLRDFSNFAAFSIGFTHFFSSKVWQQAFKSANFSTLKEIKFTPFMSIFICKP